MKIKSTFKDYYDYVANQYGGGDPHTLYLRSKISNVIDRKDLSLQSHLYLDSEDFNKELRSHKNYDLSALIVAGKIYTIFYTDYTPLRKSWKLLTQDNVDECIKYNNHKNQNYFYRKLTKKIAEKFIAENVIEAFDATVDFCRLIKSPVFLVDHDYFQTHLQNQIPCLKDLGFDKFMSAEQLYQNLEYYICNKMRSSPDLAPPVERTDVERIESHGFDKKVSFRHRK